MKSAISSLVILAISAGVARAQDSEREGVPRIDKNDWIGTMRLFLGAKVLNESEWFPVDDQGEFAFLANFGRANWDVHIALDMRFASSDEEDFLGVDFLSSSWEVNFGVRKVFDTGSIVKPYLGAGIALGGATLEVDGEEDSDDGIGIWFDAGVDFMVVGPISLGLEVSVSTLRIEFEGIDGDAGGLKFGITLGFSW